MATCAGCKGSYPESKLHKVRKPRAKLFCDRCFDLHNKSLAKKRKHSSHLGGFYLPCICVLLG